MTTALGGALAGGGGGGGGARRSSAAAGREGFRGRRSGGSDYIVLGSGRNPSRAKDRTAGGNAERDVGCRLI
jgi:hypothetical protein